MNSMDLALFMVILALLGLIAWQVFRPQKPAKDDSQSFLLIQNQIQDQQKQLQNRLDELTKTMNAGLSESKNTLIHQVSESQKLIKDITQELIKVGEGQRQVANIADNLKNLQDILKNPKQRGVLGEYYLEAVLKNVLPPSNYKMQYPFKDGSIVDAVVITKDGLIAVDSKFSLENYNRMLECSDRAERERYEAAFAGDLKIRIDETSKYVKPEEGTLDFAFMFIPSEAVYYDLLINKVGSVKATNVNLIEYAFAKKKVVVVSPTTFLAYLQTVLQGLKALRVEEAAKKIGERVSELGKHLSSYQDFMQKIGKGLGTTVSAYNAAGKEFGKINKDVYRITGEELNLKAPAVEKPEESDASSH